MTFYCLQIEFYDYGEIKAAITERETNIKPKSQYRDSPGLRAFKLWLVNKEAAYGLLELLKAGEVNIDDIYCLYSERKALSKAA